MIIDDVDNTKLWYSDHAKCEKKLKEYREKLRGLYSTDRISGGPSIVNCAWTDEEIGLKNFDAEAYVNKM